MQTEPVASHAWALALCKVANRLHFIRMYYKCTLVTTGQKHQNYWARIGYYWDFCPVVKQLKYALDSGPIIQEFVSTPGFGAAMSNSGYHSTSGNVAMQPVSRGVAENARPEIAGQENNGPNRKA